MKTPELITIDELIAGAVKFDKEIFIYSVQKD